MSSTIRSKEPTTLSSELGVIPIISGSIAGFILLLIIFIVICIIIIMLIYKKTRSLRIQKGSIELPMYSNTSYGIVLCRSSDELTLTNQDPTTTNEGSISTLLNGVTLSKTNSGDGVPTSSNASYGVTPSKMSGGDGIPTSSNESYGVTPKMSGGDGVPTSSNESYGVTPSKMNSGDGVPISSNVSYGIASKMIGDDVDAIYTEIP